MNEEEGLQNTDSGSGLSPTFDTQPTPQKSVVIFLLILIVMGFGSSGYFLFGKNVSSQKISQINIATTTNSNTPGESAATEVKKVPRKYYEINNDVVYYIKNSYYNDKKETFLEAATFEDLGNGWAKDKNYVYRNGEVQVLIGVATVKVLSPIYVADKAGVWNYFVESASIWKLDADPASFVIVGELYGKDSKNVYSNRNKIVGADPLTFSVINYEYSKDSENVYYGGEKIVGADPASFVLLRGSLSQSEAFWNLYAKDNNNVYYRSSVILNADPNSFVYLGNNSEYSKDKNNVYYRGEIIANADSPSFVLVGSYAKDKNHIFSSNKILSIEIDPSTFSVTGATVKDNKRVYFYDYYADTYNLMPYVNAPTFQAIGACGSVEKSSSFYYKDKNHVFVENTPITAIDVSSFQYFGQYYNTWGMPYSVAYAKDKNNIYYGCGEVLKDADAVTFIDLKDGYVKDKSTVWYLGNLTKETDPRTFQSLGTGYAKDSKHAYYEGSVIDKADAATFTLVKENIRENVATGIYAETYAKDKNHVYYSNGKILPDVNPVNCTPEFIRGCNPNSKRDLELSP